MTSFLDGKVKLMRGDCLELLPTLEENSIDSCVTDPPYHLTVIKTGSLFPGRREGQKRKGGGTGFMGKSWDGGDIAFKPELWTEVLRVLKPGAHLLAFPGTRTYHRMACAIEDAGFEIRDQIGWCYGSGFPKSHDVSKGIDGALGAEREIISERPAYGIGGNGCLGGHSEGATAKLTVAATEAAIQWQGWGTALKPAWEPIVLARKPLSESSIAANVLKHGTGGINVDGCRIATADKWEYPNGPGGCKSGEFHYQGRASTPAQSNSQGRWPANLIHDGSEEVVRGFPDAGGGFGVRGESPNWGPASKGGGTMEVVGFGDSGSAARFFYTAKADSDDRLGSKHPTVKPLDLIQYLVRLVTPRGGVVLDPFAGTGTSGEAAFREGFRAVLMEREPEYQADIERRMALALAGPDERTRETIKARGEVEAPGPLFAKLRQ